MPDPTNPLRYDGKRVLVTGAASGMGAVAAALLVELGAEVHALDLRDPEIDGITASYVVDLTDDAQVAAVPDRVGGDIDALFNCAGIPGTADPQLIFAVNFVGTRLLTETVLAHMPAGSAVCSLGSTSAVSWQAHLPQILELLDTPDPDAARAWGAAHLANAGYPYDFSKEVINAYTAWRSITSIADGVRMTCVNPGGTLTPATPEFTKAMKAKDSGREMLRAYPRLLGRLADPAEQVWPMIFLNSELASFINGTSLNVDAGLTGGLYTKRYDPIVAQGMRWTSPS